MGSGGGIGCPIAVWLRTVWGQKGNSSHTAKLAWIRRAVILTGSKILPYTGLF